jgi:hypothetical protein
MKKSSKKKSGKRMNDGVAAIGIDLSDRTGRFYAIDDEGKEIEEGTITLRTPELEKWARSIAPTVIAIEAGTHSPWISRLLARCGHEVIVANPGKLALITKNVLKTDSVDAQYLARLARFDRELLFCDSASRRASADRPAGDPHARHGGAGEVEADQSRTRSGQVVRWTTVQVLDRGVREQDTQPGSGVVEDSA